MADVSKLVQAAAIGPTSAAASKLVMTILLVPGNGSGPAPVHHGFTYGQRFRNPGG